MNQNNEPFFEPEPHQAGNQMVSGSDAHVKLAVQMLKQIRQSLTHVIQLFEEGDVSKATRQMVHFVGAKKELESALESEVGLRMIEGVFDGTHMVASDATRYDVPPNYASKSHLVEGDVLKLTIRPDGSYVYKQIGPVERRRLSGTLSMDSGENQHIVICPSGVYKVLAASISYHKALQGDEIVILVPSGNETCRWAAFESIKK